MHRFVENLDAEHFQIIQAAAGQMAGRKARRKQYNFNIPRERQHRKRYSPYKDIADSTQEQLVQFMKEDALERKQGGGLYTAFEDVVNEVYGAVNKVEAPEAAKPLINTLMNLTGTAQVQVDVDAEDFLSRVGLRHHRKYTNSEKDESLRDHALLHKDAYLGLVDRKGTDRFEYLQEDSTEKYGTYLDKQNKGKVVVAFRGTNPKNMIHNNDLIEDINIAAGNVNAIAEFDDYRQHVINMLDEYGDGNVSLSGYSLGGAKAVALTREADLRSRLGTTMALAPGMAPTDERLREKAFDSKIQYYYNSSDPVANALLATHGGNNHHVFYDEKNPLKAHLTLDNWAE